MNDKDKTFFEKYGLEVSSEKVNVGSSYPLYGMITKVLEQTPTKFVVELNYSIEAHMQITDPDKVEVVKKRAFEPGIFVCKVVANDPTVIVDCSTVVFGKSQAAEV